MSSHVTNEEPERDNCIIIYQNTKISRRNSVKGYSCNCLFQYNKTKVDLLTLPDHNNV